MTTTSTNTLNSNSFIRLSVPSGVPYYCTEDEWRNYTGFTNQNDFPSDELEHHLTNATEQVKKDCFHMVRWEFVTKDSSSRYFTQRRYWGNRYGAYDDGQTQIIHGEMTKYDLQVFEADVTSSVASSLWLQGSRNNRLMYQIPYEAITYVDPLNSFFILDSDWPSVSSRQIYVNYWVSGKPLDSIAYELRRACMEMTTILALMKLKTKRLKKGTVSYTLGKQSITRDEHIFDEMVRMHKDEYMKWCGWIKPFIGRKVRIGRMETEDSRRFQNYY